MKPARVGDVVCAALAVVAVADVVQLDLAPLQLVAIAQVLLWALLLLRHVHAAWVLGVPVVCVLLGVVAPGTNDDTLTQALAVDLSAYWAGRLGGARVRATAIVLLVATTPLIELQSLPLGRTDISDVLYLTAPAVLAFALGRRLTRRAEETAELQVLRRRLEADLALRAQQLLAAEQERIGQELHDVVAQGAGAVVAQATAARMLVEVGRDAEAARALAAVEDAARDALADMRRLLGVLRADQVADSGVAVP